VRHQADREAVVVSAWIAWPLAFLCGFAFLFLFWFAAGGWEVFFLSKEEQQKRRGWNDPL